jgi:hypothetical protein
MSWVTIGAVYPLFQLFCALQSLKMIRISLYPELNVAKPPYSIEPVDELQLL